MCKKLFAGYPLLACMMLISYPASGQKTTTSPETGSPFFLTHFRPQDYQHNPQNWSIVQDQRGLVYVANYDGILEYDGDSWRLIETATNTVVRSLAMGRDGTIYAGTSGDFGYLAPDSTGILNYRSLIEQVDAGDRAFSDVWGTHATSEGVYFQTRERLFRWDGQEMKVWRSERQFRTAFVVRDELYIRERGIGLHHVSDTGLVLTPGGEMFADRPIYMMGSLGTEHILIGTSNAGFFDYYNGTATPFPTEADPFLKDFELYHGCTLPGGEFALATLGAGVLIIDRNGSLVQVLNKENGMPDDWVNYVSVDAQGGLWMALNADGVVRADVPSQLTIFNEQLGLEGIVRVLQRHKDTLYVGTGTGLFRLNRASKSQGRASASVTSVLAGVPTSSLVSADSILFAGTDKGLYVIRSGVPEKLTLTEKPVFVLLESRRFPGRILVGKKDGLAWLRYGSTGWGMQEIYSGKSHPGDEIRSIAEEKDGTLWLRAADGTILRLRVSEREDLLLAERFSEKEGLPKGPVGIEYIDGRIVVFSEEGVYRLIAGRDGELTVVSEGSSAEKSRSALLRNFMAGEDGNLWYVYEDRVEVAVRQADGSYPHVIPDVLRFPKAAVVELYVEKSGIAWISDGDRLIRYDPSIEKNYVAAFPALIRRVVATRTERLLYGGTEVPVATLPTLQAADNDLRFEVSALSFNDVTANSYQFYLEGYDPTWSDWTVRPNRSYGNLPGGSYTFRVRARNAQGVLSSEADFSFRVLPPWYRTWWAYALYCIVILAVSAFSWHHYRILEENKRAQEQARELERERQINKRLQEANESLLQANRLKDEFLANTSHELRTPLTAILGFTQLLQDELPQDYQEFLGPIAANGKRLLHTLNALLDIARLRAGMMEVSLETLDMGEQAAEILRLLDPLASQKGLQVELLLPEKPVLADLDRHYFERILYNLIGNAIKFTEEGCVSVEIERYDKRACVHVRDTGIGIDEGFIPHLFEEFKQESTGLARSHEGNGLGLAITARLVELMGGEIAVESEKGKGSVFTISFLAHAADKNMLQLQA